jgi:hypothetical protein
MAADSFRCPEEKRGGIVACRWPTFLDFYAEIAVALRTKFL